MIVEEIYSSEPENTLTEMTQEDLKNLNGLLEKYEYYEIFDVLNEKRKEYAGMPTTGFDSTGGYRAKGLWGAIQSVPSFAITAAICWPAAVFAAVGALHHRIQQRWDDKDSWRNRLKPGFWAEYLATPKNYSLPHRAISGVGKGAKWVGVGLGGAVLGNLAWPKLKKAYDEQKDNAPAWLKKLIGIGTAAGLGSAALGGKDSSTDIDSSVFFDESLELTPEDVKNIDFREYWLQLSNGEVLRVRSDSPENAKKFGEAIVAILTQPQGYYDKLNKLIEKGDYRYSFYFDDGEMSYWAGDDERKALEEAKKTRVDLCKEFNKSTAIALDPLKTPKIYGSSEPRKGKTIPVPNIRNIKVLSAPPARKVFKKKTLKAPAYKYESMINYKITTMGFIVNFGASSSSEAVDMTRDFVKKFGYEQIDRIYRNSRYGEKEFVVVMGDGDRYKIFAHDKYIAEQIGISLHDAKMKAMEKCTSTKNDLTNFMAEYGEQANTVKTVTEMAKDKVKPFEPSKKAGIRAINTPSEDYDEAFDPFEI